MVYRRKMATNPPGNFEYCTCHTITSCSPAGNHAHTSSARTLCVLCLPAIRKPVAAQRASTIALVPSGCSVLYLSHKRGPTGDCVYNRSAKKNFGNRAGRKSPRLFISRLPHERQPRASGGQIAATSGGPI